MWPAKGQTRAGVLSRRAVIDVLRAFVSCCDLLRAPSTAKYCGYRRGVRVDLNAGAAPGTSAQVAGPRRVLALGREVRSAKLSRALARSAVLLQYIIDESHELPRGPLRPVTPSNISVTPAAMSEILTNSSAR